MDDSISRREALATVKDALIAWSYMPEWRDKKILEAIADLPPVLGTNLAEVGTNCISRQDAIDICDHAIDLLKGQFGAGALVAIRESIAELPPAQPESCEDTVSRQRLLSDLKELVVAWEKYPVMAEQIKGVEAAIGYVKTISSAHPERTSMQELLDVTADRDYWKAQCNSYEMTINRLTESAQPDIVRCKDCKHFNRDIPCVDGHYNGCDAWTDNGNEIMVAEDDFCSYAERRTDG